MKKLCLIIAFVLCFSIVFVSCSNEETREGTVDENIAEISTDFQKEDGEMFTDRDLEGTYDASAAEIRLGGDSASCSSSGVSVSGSRITVGKEGTYIVSGTLNDGMIIVDAGDDAKVQLVLNGADITSATSAPIYVKNANKVFLTLAEGSENTLTNGGEFVAIDDNNIDAAVFSKQDITLNGSGRLTVSSPAGHGIVGKDDLVISGGIYTVTAASHAIDANNSIRITDSAFVLAAGKDGMHSENNDDSELGYIYIASGSFDVDAQGDGISAASYLQINGGTFDILAGGGSENASKESSDGYGQMPGGFGGGGGMRPHGRAITGTYDTSSDSDSTSMKGIKAGGGLLVKGGSFTIDSADDSVHSNTSVIVEDGSFTISAGDDALHADEVLRIQGGAINITESYEGLEALNVEVFGGDITMVASDDGINAAGGNDESGFGGMRPGGDMFGGMGGGSGSSKGTVVISGGSVYMNASGDGIDANGSFTMSGGKVTVCGPTTGDTSVLDFDNTATITGGTFIGTGASQMAQTFSDSEQGVVSVSVGNQSAGTEIKLTDKSGNVLLGDSPKLSFAIIIISCPEMEKGEEYTLTVGSMSETFEAE